MPSSDLLPWWQAVCYIILGGVGKSLFDSYISPKKDKDNIKLENRKFAFQKEEKCAELQRSIEQNAQMYKQSIKESFDKSDKTTDLDHFMKISEAGNRYFTEVSIAASFIITNTIDVRRNDLLKKIGDAYSLLEQHYDALKHIVGKLGEDEGIIYFDPKNYKDMKTVVKNFKLDLTPQRNGAK